MKKVNQLNKNKEVVSSMEILFTLKEELYLVLY